MVRKGRKTKGSFSNRASSGPKERGRRGQGAYFRGASRAGTSRAQNKEDHAGTDDAGGPRDPQRESRGLGRGDSKRPLWNHTTRSRRKKLQGRSEERSVQIDLCRSAAPGGRTAKEGRGKVSRRRRRRPPEKRASLGSSACKVLGRAATSGGALRQT